MIHLKINLTFLLILVVVNIFSVHAYARGSYVMDPANCQIFDINNGVSCIGLAIFAICFHLMAFITFYFAKGVNNEGYCTKLQKARCLPYWHWLDLGSTTTLMIYWYDQYTMWRDASSICIYSYFQGFWVVSIILICLYRLVSAAVVYASTQSISAALLQLFGLQIYAIMWQSIGMESRESHPMYATIVVLQSIFFNAPFAMLKLAFILYYPVTDVLVGVYFAFSVIAAVDGIVVYDTKYCIDEAKHWKSANDGISKGYLIRIMFRALEVVCRICYFAFQWGMIAIVVGIELIVFAVAGYFVKEPYLFTAVWVLPLMTENKDGTQQLTTVSKVVFWYRTIENLCFAGHTIWRMTLADIDDDISYEALIVVYAVVSPIVFMKMVVPFLGAEERREANSEAVPGVSPLPQDATSVTPAEDETAVQMQTATQA